MQGRGLEEQFCERTLVTRIGNVQWAALPMESILELLVIFSALKQRQHVVVTPAGIAERGPVVVVPLVSPHIKHRIDRARATKGLATRLISAAAIEAGLRHRLVRIVIDLGWHHRNDGRRRMNQDALVPPAGFQQTDRDLWILRKTRGQRTSGGTGADDNVVEFPMIHGLLPVRGLTVAFSDGSPDPRNSFSAKRCVRLP